MRTIRDCKVVVVGGAGFLGSHLVDHLIGDRGCDVLVIDNLATGRMEFVDKRADFMHHDICGSEVKLFKTFRQFGARFIFNYAAMPYVPDSYEHPLRVNDVNFMGALKVINAAQEAGAEGILQVSSAEVYGEVAPGIAHFDKIREIDPCVPHSSYGASKAAIDALVQVRWREAKTPCIALRQFNALGPRETHPYIVPEIIGQLSPQQWGSGNVTPPPLTGRTSNAVIKLGNDSFRDFIYAGDAVRIAVELLERGQWGEVYNLGSETGIKMYDLAKLVGRVMGFADVRVERDEARVRPWEIWSLLSDNSKIKSIVGLDREELVDEQGVPVHRAKVNGSIVRHLTPLEEALRRTVAWYEGQGRRWPWERG